MIVLGYSTLEKSSKIDEYVQANDIDKIVILSPRKFMFPFCSTLPFEWLEYKDIIEYKPFYRLLQEINKRTLVVVNECLRTQNRNDLTFNCIRHYLNQTTHQIVFQFLPIIDGINDFMTLFDFDTRSQWKRYPFDAGLLERSQVVAKEIPISFDVVRVEASQKTKSLYCRKKAELFSGLGLKDPHTIPRNLYLIGGKERSEAAGNLPALARNQRLQLDCQTYKEGSYPSQPYFVVDMPHNHIDFNDMVTLSGQSRFSVAATDLKVDQWYISRYQKWKEELDHVYAVLQQNQKRIGSSQRTDLVCL